MQRRIQQQGKDQSKTSYGAILPKGLNDQLNNTIGHDVSTSKRENKLFERKSNSPKGSIIDKSSMMNVLNSTNAMTISNGQN